VAAVATISGQGGGNGGEEVVECVAQLNSFRVKTKVPHIWFDSSAFCTAIKTHGLPPDISVMNSRCGPGVHHRRPKSCWQQSVADILYISSLPIQGSVFDTDLKRSINGLYKEKVLLIKLIKNCYRILIKIKFKI
jgi:hypothetical protein